MQPLTIGMLLEVLQLSRVFQQKKQIVSFVLLVCFHPLEQSAMSVPLGLFVLLVLLSQSSVLSDISV